MGYTHYVERPLAIEARAFKQFVADVAWILSGVADVRREDALTLEEVAIGPDAVVFNGAGGGGYETFLFERVVAPRRPGEATRLWFCKTNQRRYDVAVTAALLRLAERVPGVIVTSDGDDDDWAAGRALVRQTWPDATEFRFNADRVLCAAT
jgi:hypothetical protein